MSGLAYQLSLRTDGTGEEYLLTTGWREVRGDIFPGLAKVELE